MGIWFLSCCLNGIRNEVSDWGNFDKRTSWFRRSSVYLNLIIYPCVVSQDLMPNGWTISKLKSRWFSGISDSTLLYGSPYANLYATMVHGEKVWAKRSWRSHQIGLSKSLCTDNYQKFLVNRRECLTSFCRHGGATHSWWRFGAWTFAPLASTVALVLLVLSSTCKSFQSKFSELDL